MSEQPKVAPLGLLGRMNAGLFWLACVLVGIFGGLAACAITIAVILFVAPAKSHYGDPFLFLVVALIGTVCPPVLLIRIRNEQMRDGGPVGIKDGPSFDAIVKARTEPHAYRTDFPITHPNDASPDRPIKDLTIERDARISRPVKRGLVITGAVFAASLVVVFAGGGLNYMGTKAQNEPEFIDWQAAQREGSREGYEAFLKLWPNSRYAPEATRKFRMLDQASDTALWKDAVGKGTKEAYERYLQQYPNGSNVNKAARIIAELAAAQPLSSVAEGQLKSLAEFRECADCPKMIVIPGGQFLMGSTASDISRNDAFENEGPQHKVTIAQRFAIGKYEVTFAEWDTCMQDGGCRGYRPGDEGWGRGNMPVMNVSWDDAKLYVRWLSQKTGKIYRLPTEAEWEYAARAGSSTKFYFGNDSKSLCKYANVADEAGSQNIRGSTGFSTWQICNDGYFHTASVGSLAPNKFGLYDMLGNVGEWVEDVWHPNYNGAPSDGSAWLTGGDPQIRIGRGGSYYNLEDGVRSAVRLNYRAGSQGNLAGFRVARTLAN